MDVFVRRILSALGPDASFGLAGVVNLDKIDDPYYFDAVIEGRMNPAMRLIFLCPEHYEGLERFARGEHDSDTIAAFHIFIHELTHAAYHLLTWPHDLLSTPEEYRQAEALNEAIVEWTTPTVVARTLYGCERAGELPPYHFLSFHMRPYEEIRSLLCSNWNAFRV